MDHRDIQSGTNVWYDEFDESNMLARINELEVDDKIMEDVLVTCHFKICPTCDGKGTHVNPSIDSNGITAEEWDRDWSYEDRENYVSGFYDVDCYECCGKRVVPVPDEDINSPDILKAIRSVAYYNYLDACERAVEIKMGY